MTVAEMNFLAARAGSLAACTPGLLQLKSQLCSRGKSQYHQHQSPSAASPNLTSLVTRDNHVRSARQQQYKAPVTKSTTGMSLRDHLMASRAAPAHTSSNAPSRTKAISSVHSVASTSRPSYSKQTYQARFTAPKYEPPKHTLTEGANIKQLLQVTSSRLHAPSPQAVSPKVSTPDLMMMSSSPSSSISSRYSDTSSPLSTLSDVATQILQNDQLQQQQQAASSSSYTQDIAFRQLRPVSRTPSECSSSSFSSRCSTPPFSPRSPLRTTAASHQPDRSFDLSKQTKEILSAGKPVMHEDRVNQLLEALKNVDCCDPNERSNIMPFRSEDGSWKMVRVKRIGGAWLMQMPGKQQPVVFIPKLNAVSPLAACQHPKNNAQKDSPSSPTVMPEIIVPPASIITDSASSSTPGTSLIKSLLSKKSTISKMLTI